MMRAPSGLADPPQASCRFAAPTSKLSGPPARALAGSGEDITREGACATQKERGTLRVRRNVPFGRRFPPASYFTSCILNTLLYGDPPFPV